MPHDRIAKLSGVPHAAHMRGSHFEHDGHETAGMNRAGRETEELAGSPHFGKKIPRMGY